MGSGTIWNITPTQGLILEVLAARWRLGETLWTFESSSAVSNALRQLGEKNLVETTHGITENTVRASLTQNGIREAIDPNYTPPLNPLPSSDDRLKEGIAKIMGLLPNSEVIEVRPVKYVATVTTRTDPTTTTTETFVVEVS
jgi:hypothetical protein